MALSLDSIYKPLNEFFINKFASDQSRPIFFKFDKFGSVISETDFSSPELAVENLSYLVNRIPIDEPDGLHVFLSQNLVDDSYFFRMLSPSLPHIPPDADQPASNALLTNFSVIKDAALKIWATTKLETITKPLVQFRPAKAQPSNWYDKSNGLWSKQVFQIKQEASIPADESPKFQLWKLKTTDVVMQKVLGLKEDQAATKVTMYQNILSARANPRTMMLRRTAALEVSQPGMIRPSGLEMLGRPAGVGRVGIARESVLGRAETGPRGPVGGLRGGGVDTINPTFKLHNSYLEERDLLSLRRRVLVDDYVRTVVPKQPVNTQEISISFDYCLVTLNRPWYVPSFINASWFVPHTEQGALTSKGNAPGMLRSIPIGFVAVKSLNIEANWALDDIQNSTTATDFGPFKIDSQIVSNKLSHEGIQIVGWLLEKMPDLPPVSDPSLANQPASVLQIKSPVENSVTNNQPFDVVVEASSSVMKVELRLDGQPLATIPTKTGDQFTFHWDISSLTEGNHFMEAIGFDAAGNDTSRDTVTWFNDTPFI